MVKPTPKPEPELDPEPPAQKEAELVPPVPAHQAQPPMMAMQEMLGGVQMGALEGEMASGSQGPLGELPESSSVPTGVCRHMGWGCEGKYHSLSHGEGQKALCCQQSDWHGVCGCWS